MHVVDNSLASGHVTVAGRPEPEDCGGVGMHIGAVLVFAHHEATKPSKKIS